MRMQCETTDIESDWHNYIRTEEADYQRLRLSYLTMF